MAPYLARFSVLIRTLCPARGSLPAETSGGYRLAGIALLVVITFFAGSSGSAVVSLLSGSSRSAVIALPARSSSLAEISPLAGGSRSSERALSFLGVLDRL